VARWCKQHCGARAYLLVTHGVHRSQGSKTVANGTRALDGVNHAGGDPLVDTRTRAATARVAAARLAARHLAGRAVTLKTLASRARPCEGSPGGLIGLLIGLVGSNIGSNLASLGREFLHYACVGMPSHLLSTVYFFFFFKARLTAYLQPPDLVRRKGRRHGTLQSPLFLCLRKPLGQLRFFSAEMRLSAL